MKHRYSVRFFLLVILFLGVITVVPFAGPVWISPAEINLDQNALIFWQLRVPRILLGLIAGSGLAVTGLVTQAMLRNPLATPYTIGMSSGSALGAVMAIKLGLDFAFAGLSVTTITAFGGAIVTAVIIYLLSTGARRVSSYILLLAGVAIAYIIAALNMFIHFLADFTETHRMIRWAMGGLETVGYAKIAASGLIVLAGFIWLWSRAASLNILSLGEDHALAKGIDVDRLIRQLFFVVAAMVAAIVSVAGPIGFVGLIVPHIMRLWFGPDNRYLMPGAFLTGAIFLIISDLLARLLLAPAEIPVGIITAMVGGPFFIGMLLRQRLGRTL